MARTGAEWAILEKRFPQSINRGVHWTKLVEGECADIDMADFERTGVLRYSPAIGESKDFFAKRFVTTNNPQDSGSTWYAYIYGRRWLVDPNTPKILRYTDVYSETPDEGDDSFLEAGAIDFSDDGSERISMIVPVGGSAIAILTSRSGYLLSSANGSDLSFRKSQPYYGVGCDYDGSWYSNAEISGSIATTWTSRGDHGSRHYLWRPGEGATELSLRVRDFAADDGKNAICKINWSRNYVVAGSLIYDLLNKRVYHISGNEFASFSSRSFNEPHYRPVTWQAIGFVTTGEEGSFDAHLDWGQVNDNLNGTQAKTFEIEREEDRRLFWHQWNLDRPITARVGRIRIDNLKGIGISEIHALTRISDDVNSNVEMDG